MAIALKSLSNIEILEKKKNPEDLMLLFCLSEYTMKSLEIRHAPSGLRML